MIAQERYLIHTTHTKTQPVRNRGVLLAAVLLSCLAPVLFLAILFLPPGEPPSQKIPPAETGDISRLSLKKMLDCPLLTRGKTTPPAARASRR